MKHMVRAKGIVGRAMPEKLVVRDGPKRVIHVDVTAWHKALIKAVAKGLRQAERDARVLAFGQAANAVIADGRLSVVREKNPDLATAFDRICRMQNARSK